MHSIKRSPLTSSFSNMTPRQENNALSKLPELSGTGDQNINERETTQSVDSSILKILGLCDYYPQKITVEEVMQKSTEKLDKTEDIPWYVMQKLLMLDYRGRYVNHLTSESPNRIVSSSKRTENLKETHSPDGFIKSFLENVRNELPHTIHTTLPHPSDVIVAIFLCSSDFLRQILSEKMYMCHVSIPFLLPDLHNSNITYLLWTFRSFIGRWELPDGTSFETPIVNYELPIVSFLRLGEVSRSKSKLMNDIISSQGHNTFFHKDLSSDIKLPEISSGLADVTWFFPSRGTKSKLDEALTFINLHGDSNALYSQRQFLKTISSTLLVMIETKELQNECSLSCIKDFLACNKKLVIIICENPLLRTPQFENIFTKFVKEFEEKLDLLTFICDFYSTRSKTASELTNETIDGFLQCLKCEKKLTLEMIKDFSEECNISVDENDEDNEHGKTLALEVFQHVNGDNLDQTKAKQLQLQERHTQDLGKREVEEQRSKVNTMEPDSTIVNQQEKVRRANLIYVCNNPSGMFDSFMKYLLETDGSGRLYFLKWLSLFLDETSRKALAKLHEDYNEFRKNRDKKLVDMKVQQQEFIEIRTKISVTSLGLEHLFRELGHAFEILSSLANEVSNEMRIRVNKLPKVMAELMLSGYPLELVDGDASRLHVSWVTAVLGELKWLIKDKKVFVLSVLGVQKSGKTTLLNTMFGIQFPVRAGRCTRGIYAQLVPVPKGELKSSCDYIFVVDTEGLHVSDFDLTKYQRDNELATFVIGLGDMTLINVKGENPKEMEDVLQIAVHAFLRMRLVNKNLKLQPSCFFLHQNVGAVSASDKTKFGRQKLKNNLDQMTVETASQENCTEICSFTDVIDFDVDKNIWYFSDLWEGDPPMAPANPAYSEKVREVKQAILSEIFNMQRVVSRLSDISIHIKDLWNGIFRENFVFRYKNTLEVRAYRSLESCLNELFWFIEDSAQECFTNSQYRIMSTESELDDVTEGLSHNFLKHITEVHDEAKEKLEEYFRTSENREIIKQWQESSIIKLLEKKDELFSFTNTEIRNACQLRKSQLRHQGKIENAVANIRIRAKELASSLKNKNEIMSDHDLERKFDENWTNWINSLLSNKQNDQVPDVGETICKVFEELNDESASLKKHLTINNLNSPVQKMKGNFKITKEHISIKKKYFGTLGDKISFQDCQEKIYNEISTLFDDIENYLNGLCGSCFSREQVEMVFKKPQTMIEKINKSESLFKLTNSFSVELVTLIIRYAVPIFKKISVDYLKETEALITKRYKGQSLEMFKAIYKGTEKEIMVADMLASCLMNVLDKTVMEKSLVELAKDIRINNAFLQSKMKLLRSVQTDMLEKGKFEDYLLYLRNNKKFLKGWLKVYVNKYIFERQTSKYAELSFIQIKSLTEEIRQDVEDAERKCKSDFKKWLEIFHERAKERLALPRSDLSMVLEENISNITSFKEHIMENLDSVEKELEERAKRVSSEDFEQMGETVYTRIERQCLGCCEQCPFCNAPCSMTMPDHDTQHNAVQHYPQGAGGMMNVASEKLVTETCPVFMAREMQFQDPSTGNAARSYKQYKELHPDWNIQFGSSMETSLYWKWFMAKFGSELAKEYEAKDPDIPEAWKSITKEQALASLEE